MQRTAKLIASAAGTALLLSACGGSPQPGGPSTTNPEEKVTLQFQSLAYQPGTVKAVEEIVSSWNADNPSTQVVLSQASWDGVHDQLVTQFQGRNAPDIIHNEAGDMTGFAQQGYLADLGPHLSSELKDGVRDEWWDALTFDGSTFAAPIMMQSYVAFANKTAFADAGVEIPTGDSLTWTSWPRSPRSSPPTASTASAGGSPRRSPRSPTWPSASAAHSSTWPPTARRQSTSATPRSRWRRPSTRWPTTTVR